MAAVAEAAHAAGALLGGRQHGRHAARPAPARPRGRLQHAERTKTLGGHSDLLLGAVSVRDAALAADLRAGARARARSRAAEAWLLHRSLATLELRLERQSANALAVARFLQGRPEVERRPPSGPRRAPGARSGRAPDAPLRRARRASRCASAEQAQAFLGALELVAEATSFGGVHSTAERRGRWGTDAVPRASSASRPAARTPRTSSPTSSARSTSVSEQAPPETSSPHDEEPARSVRALRR